MKYFNRKNSLIENFERFDQMLYINRTETPSITLAQMNILFKLRSLWRDLAIWNRAYLISRFTSGDYSQEAFTRLYKIPPEFGNLMSMIFGTDIGHKYEQLLSNQSIVIRDFIEALISGDTNAANEHYLQMYQHADERARFLASINPFWDVNQLRNLMYRFLNLTIEEAEAFIAGDYKKSISVFDTLLAHADKIGDYFSEGLYNYLLNSNRALQPAQPERR